MVFAVYAVPAGIRAPYHPPFESTRTSFRAPNLEDRIITCHNLFGEYSGAEENVDGGSFMLDMIRPRNSGPPLSPEGYSDTGLHDLVPEMAVQ